MMTAKPSSKPSSSAKEQSGGSTSTLNPINPPLQPSIPATSLRSQLVSQNNQSSTVPQIPASSTDAVSSSTAAASQAVMTEQGGETLAVDFIMDLSELEISAIKQPKLLQKVRQNQVGLPTEMQQSHHLQSQSAGIINVGAAPKI